MLKQNMVNYLYNDNNSIQLIICLETSCSFSIHNHASMYIIGIILDGSVKLTLNDETINYSKNIPFVIEPYALHSLESNEKYSIINLCIDKKIFEENNSSKQIYNFLLHASKHNYITQEIKKKLIECVGIYDFTNTFINSKIIDIKNQIETYPEINMSIDMMASSLEMSKYHFIRTFKKDVGLTPHRFQIQNRVRKAQKLLLETNSLTNITFATGFYDQSHFIKCFSKIVKMVPSDYRMSCKKLNDDSKI